MLVSLARVQRTILLNIDQVRQLILIELSTN